MNKQQGFSPVFILLAIATATVILAFGIFLTQNNSRQPTSSQTNSSSDCINTSYGGCDSDPDFYKWEDDGLP